MSKTRMANQAKFKVKLVICDLDGTLLHTAPQVAEAANLMLAAMNKSMLPVAQITSFIGNGVHVLVQCCLAVGGTGEPEASMLEQAYALFHHFYAANVTFSKPFDGVVTGLQVLQQKGFKLACVTNKPEAFTLPLLEKSGLAPFFEIVVSGDTLPHKKPHPMPLHHVCEMLKVPESETMLVGDSETDIATARAAGCFVVTVPYGYNQGRPVDAKLVDASIKDLSEVPSLLH